MLSNNIREEHVEKENRLRVLHVNDAKLIIIFFFFGMLKLFHLFFKCPDLEELRMHA